MSFEALLDATLLRIRTACGYDANNSSVMADGEPEPRCGQVFVAVHAGSWRSLDQSALRLHEALDVMVTISMRTGHIPKDRLGQEAIRKASTGIYARAEAIRAALHQNDEVIRLANVAMGAIELTPIDPGDPGAVNGFIEPLKFAGADPPRRVDALWFDGEEEEPGPPSGLTLELRFGDAERVQRIESQA